MADGTPTEDEIADAAPHYDFDAEFQTKIGALTIRDAAFATRTAGLIDPSFFENEADSCIVRAVLDHSKVYKVAPSPASITVILRDAIVSKKIRGDLVPEVKLRALE